MINYVILLEPYVLHLGTPLFSLSEAGWHIYLMLLLIYSVSLPEEILFTEKSRESYLIQQRLTHKIL